MRTRWLIVGGTLLVILVLGGVLVHALTRPAAPRAQGPAAASTPGGVAVLFAQDLGTHNCQALYGVTTMRQGGAPAQTWTRICQTASSKLIHARASSIVPFSSSTLRGVTDAVEVTISTGAGRPATELRNGADLGAGLVVLVGRPAGLGYRVLVVPLPGSPALGPNYGWTFH